MTKKENTNFVEDLRKVFVSIEIFNLRMSPIEKIVYGATGVILLGVLGAIVAFFVKK